MIKVEPAALISTVPLNKELWVLQNSQQKRKPVSSLVYMALLFWRQQRGNVRNGKEHVRNINLPEPDKPVTVKCREKCFADREVLDLDTSHLSKVLVSREEDDSQRSAIIYHCQYALSPFTTSW